MQLARYQSLLSDNSIIKLRDVDVVHLLCAKNQYVVSFHFVDKGFPKHFSDEPLKRIFFDVYPFDGMLQDVPVRSFSESALILVNSEAPEYAMAIEIKVDSLEKIASLEVIDLPELGCDEMTIEEIDGIKLKLFDISHVEPHV